MLESIEHAVMWFCLKCSHGWKTPTAKFCRCPNCCSDNILVCEFVTSEGSKNE